MDDFGPVDEPYEPGGDEQGPAATPSPDAAQAAEKQEILDLIERSGIPTLQNALYRVDEDAPFVPHDLKGSDPELAARVYQYTLRHPEEREELLLKIRERVGELERLLDRARQLDHAGAIDQAIAAWQQYQQMVPADSEAASAIGRLKGELLRRQRTLKLFYVKLAVAGVLVLVAVWGVVHLWVSSLCGSAESCLTEKKYQDSMAAGEKLRSIPPITLGRWRRDGIAAAGQAKEEWEKRDTMLRLAEDHLRKDAYHEAVPLIEWARKDDSPDFRARARVLDQACERYKAAAARVGEALKTARPLMAKGAWYQLITLSERVLREPENTIAAKAPEYEQLSDLVAKAKEKRAWAKEQEDKAVAHFGSKEYKEGVVILDSLLPYRDTQDKAIEKRKSEAQNAERDLRTLEMAKDWPALDKLAQSLKVVTDFVPDKMLDAARQAIGKAGVEQEARLEAAKAAYDGKDGIKVLDCHDAAKAADPKGYFAATAQIAQWAREAEDWVQGPARIERQVRGALAESKFAAARTAIAEYRKLCRRDDPKPDEWTGFIAKKEEAQEGEAKGLDAQLARADPKDSIVQIGAKFQANDVESAFPCTPPGLKKVADKLREFAGWEAEWGKVVSLVRRREYATALAALKAAGGISQVFKGPIELPKPDGEFEKTAATAKEAEDRVLAMREPIEKAAKDMEDAAKAGDKQPAKLAARKVLLLDPTDWLGHTMTAVGAALGDRFAQVEGGKFLFGSVKELRDSAIKIGLVNDLMLLRDSSPESWVTLPRFFMGIRLVSVEEYCKYLNKKTPANVEELVDLGDGAPIVLKDKRYHAAGGRGDLPITRVSWNGAMAYCTWLSQNLPETLEVEDENLAHLLRNVAPYVQMGCRLPTEAEWEFAAGWDPRDQKKRLLAFGDEAGAFPKTLRPVTDDTPPLDVSPHGCRDMATNARQWVHDWYGPYPKEERENPQGPETGDKKVIRGGSFEKGLGLTFLRWNELPNGKLADVGFRVVLVLTKRATGTK